jgi:hypothetical protein
MYWEGIRKRVLKGIFQYLVKLGVLFNIPWMELLCHRFNKWRPCQKNRSLKEMTSCTLHEISLPLKLGNEAFNCANNMPNKSPHKYFQDKTPFKAWSGKKLEVTNFHVFGLRVWAYISYEKRTTLNLYIIECTIIGYPYGVKGYRLIDPSKD